MNNTQHAHYKIWLCLHQSVGQNASAGQYASVYTSTYLHCEVKFYRVLNTRGASHAPVFSIEVQIGELTCVGSGYSKREAKNAAARQMIASLDTAKQVLDTTEVQPAVKDVNPLSLLVVSSIFGPFLVNLIRES